MKICFAALGYLPIPPEGYGAVESIIWQYAIRLRARGHQVDIINRDKHRIIWDVLRAGRYDFIHCHMERGLSRVQLASRFTGSRVIVTTHRGYWLPDPNKDELKCLRMTAYSPRIIVMREDIAAELRRRNPAADVVVIPSGTEVKDISFSSQGNGRAICLAIVEKRKRQDFVAAQLLAAGIPCDFVGPVREEILPPGASYLGAWTRDEMRQRLTDYSALILVSDREGGGPPLAVAEGLAAGLPVVVSPMAYGNLDLTKPFVFPVEQDGDFVPAVQGALSLAPEIRPEVRSYAEENFDFDQLVVRYEKQLEFWMGNS